MGGTSKAFVAVPWLPSTVTIGAATCLTLTHTNSLASKAHNNNGNNNNQINNHHDIHNNNDNINSSNGINHNHSINNNNHHENNNNSISLKDCFMFRAAYDQSTLAEGFEQYFHQFENQMSDSQPPETNNRCANYLSSAEDILRHAVVVQFLRSE